MGTLRGVTGLALSACLICASPARADVVTDWNAIALPIIAANHAGPAGIVDIAMVQAAVYDAIRAYDKRFRSYAVDIQGAAGSPVAAAAKAARDVLVARFPSQESSIHGTYTAYLANHGLFETDDGVDVGQQAASALLALRDGDGSFPATFPPFTGGTAPGQWRPTPPGNLPMAAPWLGAVRPFAIDSTADFQPAPLPLLTSAEYAEAYNEVKSLGSATSTTRTAQQSHLSRFYGDNFLALWNRTLRSLASAHLSTLADSARLFALANLASADAIICAWEAKKGFNFWRPITAIREGHLDDNAMTEGDPAWTPYLTTPPYPDYTSGANNISSAMTRTLELFFDTDKVTFTILSMSPLFQAGDANTITYSRFSDAIKDVIDVRIYQGIHFRFADTEARSQGRRVANFVFRNFLQPLEN